MLTLAPPVAVIAHASPESTWSNAAARVEAALRVGDGFEARSALNALEKLPTSSEAQRRRLKQLREAVEALERSSL